MWDNDDNARGFMFPPMLHAPTTYQTDTTYTNGPRTVQHHFRGRRGTRNYQSSNSYQHKNNVANKQFYCDTCDRAFDSADLLDEHFSQHKTCGWDGCTFQAHYKIVEMHVKMQHETGFADKIMMLNTPEDIEQWKMERRKNYPTAANVARRQAQQAEKLERGEVIPSQEFGKFQKTGNGRFQRNGMNRGKGRQRMTNGSDRPTYESNRGRGGRGKRRRPGNNYRTNNNATADNLLPTITDDYFGWSEESSSVKRFAGIGNTKPVDPNTTDSASGQDVGDPITDSDGETIEPSEQKPTERSYAHIPKALENLLAAYPSDSEEEAEKSTKPEAIPVKPRVQHHSKPTNKSHNQPQNRPSLLSRLLVSEIQEERNKIFQCVRYIVQNEFFGIR